MSFILSLYSIISSEERGPGFSSHCFKTDRLVGIDKGSFLYLCGNVSKRQVLGIRTLVLSRRKRGARASVCVGGGNLWQANHVLKLSKAFCLAWYCAAVRRERWNLLCQLHESPDWSLTASDPLLYSKGRLKQELICHEIEVQCSSGLLGALSRHLIKFSQRRRDKPVLLSARGEKCWAVISKIPFLFQNVISPLSASLWLNLCIVTDLWKQTNTQTLVKLFYTPPLPKLCNWYGAQEGFCQFFFFKFFIWDWQPQLFNRYLVNAIVYSRSWKGYTWNLTHVFQLLRSTTVWLWK